MAWLFRSSALCLLSCLAFFSSPFVFPRIFSVLLRASLFPVLRRACAFMLLEPLASKFILCFGVFSSRSLPWLVVASFPLVHCLLFSSPSICSTHSIPVSFLVRLRSSLSSSSVDVPSLRSPLPEIPRLFQDCACRYPRPLIRLIRGSTALHNDPPLHPPNIAYSFPEVSVRQEVEETNGNCIPDD